MTEDFLHFIWQHQYFDHRDLQTTDHRTLQIIFPGFHNHDAGPDFYQSRIKLGELEWVGGVEIHLFSSDFMLHGHHLDRAYGAVILHVVWEADEEVMLHDGFSPPVLILRGRISNDLLERYGSLVHRTAPILCGDQLPKVGLTSVYAMIERAASRRLEEKAAEAITMARQCAMNWPEVTYRLTARVFGLKVNGIPFLRLAQLTPLKILMKVSSDVFQTEALLFGMAGFLEDEPADQWQRALKKEFNHLRIKFQLHPPMDVSEWKFLRMRPPNFPTIRIAQFAAFVSRLEEWGQLEKLEEILSDLQTSLYWSEHFVFGKPTLLRQDTAPGKDFNHLLVVNVWVPVMLARAMYMNHPELKAEAVRLLHSLPPEKNAVTRWFSDAGITPANAFETQGLLFQHRNGCLQKRCLDCEVGMKILGRS